MALNVGINFGHGRLLPLLLVMLLVERFYCSVNSGKKCHRATATEARVSEGKSEGALGKGHEEWEEKSRERMRAWTALRARVPSERVGCSVQCRF